MQASVLSDFVFFWHAKKRTALELSACVLRGTNPENILHPFIHRPSCNEPLGHSGVTYVCQFEESHCTSLLLYV